MLESVIAALNIKPDGVYLDGTFGRGGHAAAVLKGLSAAGRLYALDRDPAAISEAEQQFSQDKRFTIRHGSFETLMQFCEEWKIEGRINGVLLDLGVSSPQLDDPARGFSFQSDSPLDMRMDNSAGLSAREWLASAAEQEIADVLWQYGEERYARRIAKRIVHQRIEQPLKTTAELVQLITEASPRMQRHKHPATRSFQAIRIFINRELEALKNVLPQAVSVMAPAGRLAIISFHSLEDRIVKRFMREQAAGDRLPRGLPVKGYAANRRLKLIGRAQKPLTEEVKQNPRARSAVLRVAEKLQ